MKFIYLPSPFINLVIYQNIKLNYLTLKKVKFQYLID